MRTILCWQKDGISKLRVMTSVRINNLWIVSIPAIALVLICCWPVSTSACECLQIRTLDRGLEESDVIFAGKALAVDTKREGGL